MKTIVKILLMSALAATPFASGALAADLIEPSYEQVPEVVPVEIGSGWYLRGDVSYDFKSDSEGTYRTFGTCDTCGGVPGYSTSDYDSWNMDESANFGVGFGYQFTDYFRGDLTATYWKSDIFGEDKGLNCADLCGSTETSEATAWELMANVYADLGTFAGFTPYVGGGVGAVHLKYDDFDSVNYIGGVEQTPHDSFAGEESWRFAYSLMAGVSYDLTQALKLDVGYKFTDIDGGKMFGANSLGGVVSGEDDGFQRHTIQAGVRYSLF